MKNNLYYRNRFVIEAKITKPNNKLKREDRKNNTILVELLFST